MAVNLPDFRSGLNGTDRVLVTGGSGFIGTNLVAAYRAAGVTVANFDVAHPRSSEDRDLWTRVNVRQTEDVRAAVHNYRPSHVFHLAARTDLGGKELDDYATNVGGVRSLLSALAELSPPVDRLVVSSSRMVCRIGYQPTSDIDYCPPNAYGASKVETESLVRESDLPWVLGRPTSIWGPWFDVPYRDFFLSVARGRYAHPAGRQVLKHFGYVANTVWQLHRLMTAPDEEVLGRTFYLADDPPIEVRDFATRICAALHQRPPRSVPLVALRVVALAGDVAAQAGWRAPLTTFRLDNLLTTMLHDPRPLREVAGNPPYDLDHGIVTTLDWMRREGLVGSARGDR